MTETEIVKLAGRFVDALRRGDVAAMGRLYADDIAVWHSTDGLDQTKDQNLRLLAWMARNVEGLAFDDIRQDFVADGFCQRQVLRGTNPPLAAPCMLRVWCADGRITRIEEYIDSARVAALLPSR